MSEDMYRSIDLYIDSRPSDAGTEDHDGVLRVHAVLHLYLSLFMHLSIHLYICLKICIDP